MARMFPRGLKAVALKLAILNKDAESPILECSPFHLFDEANMDAGAWDMLTTQHWFLVKCCGLSVEEGGAVRLRLLNNDLKKPKGDIEIAMVSIHEENEQDEAARRDCGRHTVVTLRKAADRSDFESPTDSIV